MIDYSLIRLIPSDESYMEFSYQVKKAAEGPYIKEIFGWDEQVQIRFHAEDWEQIKPDIIVYDKKPIGTIYTHEDGTCLEIGRFFILPEYENKGIGSFLLKDILEKADRRSLLARLKYLRNNPAHTLYERFGFKVTSFDKIFYSAERKPNNKNT
jgi:GNAT superfamily N-acetyltransferase